VAVNAFREAEASTRSQGAATADAARFAELLYPPDLAPALFVCVETLCSPPIKEADGLAAQVREIRKLAAEAAR